MAESIQQPYRWIIVSASALILALSMGTIVNGMSAYIVPMQDSYGWSRADISLINVAGIVGLAFGGLLTGPLADRFGTRPVVLSGAVVLSLSYVSTYFAVELWQFYTVIFLAGFLGCSHFTPNYGGGRDLVSTRSRPCDRDRCSWSSIGTRRRSIRVIAVDLIVRN